jgi:AcrR family transcriptional regulator
MARIKLVKCPLCKGKLEIDLSTGTVYRHFEKKKGEEVSREFDSAVDKVAGKDEKLDALFSKAKEKEKTKDLDALFRKAAEKAKDDIEEEEEEEEEESDT